MVNINYKLIFSGRETQEEELTELQYSELKKATDILSNALKLEEVFVVPVLNLIEFEKSVVASIVDDIYGCSQNYFSAHQRKMMFSKGIGNVLSPTELYLDKGRGYYGEMFKEGYKQRKTEFKVLTNQMYDQHIEYLLCQELVNYLKHKSLIVHGTTTGSKWDNEFKYSEYRLNAHILKSELMFDSRFNAIENKMTDLPDRIDILPLVKKYISHLYEIQSTLRINAKISVDEARALILKTINHLNCKSNNIQGIYLCEYSGGEEVSKVAIMLEWDDVRIELIDRYSSLIKLACRHVSPEYNKQQIR